MKTDAEVQAEVDRIDRNIDHVKVSIDATDATIARLLKLQAGRHEYLKKLSAQRSEIQTYELDLGLK